MQQLFDFKYYKHSYIYIWVCLLFTTSLFAQSSAVFDGIDDKATVPHHSDFNLGTSDFTIEAIVKAIPMDQPTMTLVSKRTYSSNGFALMVNTINGITFTVQIGKKTFDVSANALEVEGCHFLAVKRVGTDVFLYVDNNVYSVGTSSVNINTTTDLVIGADGASIHNHFQGIIEELRFWGIARKDTDILEWNNACISPTLAGLIADWSIEEGSGQFFHDVAQEEHHAYLGTTFNADAEDPQWDGKTCLAPCCEAHAGFEVSTNTPLAAQWVNFTNTSTGASTYEWSVDNQVVGTTENLQYSFGMGVYIVRLKVTTGVEGCASFYSQVIEVTQEPAMCASPNNQLSTCTEADLENPNTPFLIRDNFGNCFTPGSIALPAPSLTKINNPNFPPGQVCDCGHFRLYFRDVIDNRTELNPLTGLPEGYGFNHPTLGQQRRDALCRVYEDVSELISTPSTVSSFVRIEVRLSDNGSGVYMAPGVLGLGGTYFTDLGQIFAHGEVAKTLITGTDSYQDLNLYDPAFATVPHGNIRINFGTNWNFNMTIAPPLSTSGQRDFYAVALHEALHSLGFYSMITANGTSAASAWGTPNLYTMYDSYLLNATTSLPLISNTSSTNTACGTSGQTCTATTPTLGTLSACPHFGGSHTNNNNHDVYFDFSVGFEPGSSLSHFNCTTPFSTAYIMNKAYTPNRAPNIAEVETLCDIGYTTTGLFGQDLTGQSLGNTEVTYTNVCTHPCQVIGANDIINPATSNPYYICRIPANCPLGQTTGEITINFADIFANDNGAGNTPTGIECLTIHGGGGCFTSITSTNFTYQPDPLFGGWATLSYVPTCNNGGTIVRGSTTYILINVQYPPDPVCEVYAPNDCNLVCNGDFDGYNGFRIWSRQSNLDNFAFENITTLSPLRVITCSNLGDQYIQFRGLEWSNLSHSFGDPITGITLELAKPIQPGESVILNFDAASLSLAYPTANPALEIYGSENLPCAGLGNNISSNCNTASSTCTQYIPYCIANNVTITNRFSATINGNSCGYWDFTNYNWQTYTVNYTHTGTTNINHLVIGWSSGVNNFYVGGDIILDKVEVHKVNTIAVPMNITATVSNPNPCVGTSTNITYNICIDASAGAALPTSVDLSHDLFGSTTMAYGAGGDFDANGQRTVLLSDFTPDPVTGDLCLSLTLELDIVGATNQPEDVLLLIDAGEMCFTSATVAQSLNQITTSTPLNSATTLSITPSVTTASLNDVITYTVQMCNTLSPPNGDLTGITLDILPQPGLTYNFTAPFIAPYTFDLNAGVCSTFTFTADVIADCIAPEVEVAATSSCVPYSQTATAVVVGSGANITFPIEAEEPTHNIPTLFTATALGSNTEVYGIGLFASNIDFVSGANTNTRTHSGTCANGFSPYLVRYDNCGFNWAVEIPACAYFIDLNAIPDVEVGQNGDVYVAFAFTGSFTINSTTYTSQGGADIAIIKYTSAGVPVWVRTEGGVGNDVITDLETYFNGTNEELFITGTLSGATSNTITFNTLPTSTTINYVTPTAFCTGCNPVGLVPYLAAFTDNGTTVSGDWAKTINTRTLIGKLAVDPNGNVYMSGHANSSFIFNSVTVGNATTSLNQDAASLNDPDVFVLKYSNSGTEIWAEVYGSNRMDIVGGEISNFGIDIECQGTTNLGLLFPSGAYIGGTGSRAYMQAGGVHLLNLSASNGSLNWEQPVATPTTSILTSPQLTGNQTYQSNLTIDGTDYIISGSFFLTDPTAIPVANGFEDIDFHGTVIDYTDMAAHPAHNSYLGWFVESFDNTGNVQWVNANTSIVYLTPANDKYASLINTDLEVDNSGNLYSPFILRGTATIGTTNITGGVTGNQDVMDGFLAKFDASTGVSLRPVNNNEVANSGKEEQTSIIPLQETISNITTKLYPNPTTGRVTLEIISDLERNKVEQITIFDVTGRRVQQVQIDSNSQNKFEINLEAQQSGVYFIEIMINQELITKRVVLMN